MPIDESESDFEEETTGATYETPLHKGLSDDNVNNETNQVNKTEDVDDVNLPFNPGSKSHIVCRSCGRNICSQPRVVCTNAHIFCLDCPPVVDGPEKCFHCNGEYILSPKQAEKFHSGEWGTPKRRGKICLDPQNAPRARACSHFKCLQVTRAVGIAVDFIAQKVPEPRRFSLVWPCGCKEKCVCDQAQTDFRHFRPPKIWKWWQVRCPCSDRSIRWSEEHNQYR
jgi:hypothetical protein